VLSKTASKKLQQPVAMTFLVPAHLIEFLRLLG